MAVDFIVALPCPVKKELTTEGLLSLLKERGRANALLAMLQNDGLSREEAMAKKITINLMSTEGVVEQQEVAVEEMFMRGNTLAKYQPHCAKCHAAQGRDFGCCDAINYPITEDGEKWLAQVVEKAKEKGLPNTMALDFLLDNGVSGINFAHMRRDKRQTFFTPPDAQKFELDGREFDLNQVWEVLIGPPNIERPHQIALLFLSGGLRIEDEQPKSGTFQQACSVTDEDNGKKNWWVFDMPYNEGDDRTVIGLKSFFHALFCAFSMGVPLQISY